MKTIHVNASNAYDVMIGSGLLAFAGEAIRAVTKAKRICIVSDSTVYPLYAHVVSKSLQNTGIDTVYYTFPAGESSKNGTTYLELLNFLATSQITRSDAIVALGGGVVGDLAGFAAATYLRGIDFIQIPTTLLAAVDSSVGGKTAIDLPAGKNLAGAFYQPKLVLCDTDTLSTLPPDTFRDGCAEVIKYGILYDEALFSHLEDHGLDFQREAVIARCVELKRNVVHEDEFDHGARQMLNLGHTIGHAVEAQSHFSVSHGKAVAIGTAIVSRAAHRMGKCSAWTQERICRILTQFGLPIHTQYSASELLISALSDKKREGSIVNLIIPEKIGQCTRLPTPVSQLEALIEAGL